MWLSRKRDIGVAGLDEQKPLGKMMLQLTSDTA
jgi:hypothetical protein